MQQRLQQAQDHEIEVKQLRETLQEYNKEFAQVKNQEVTIQKLRDQLKNLEDEIEDRAAVSAAVVVCVCVQARTTGVCVCEGREGGEDMEGCGVRPLFDVENLISLGQDVQS